MMMRYVLILMGLFCWMGSALAVIETETETATLDLTTSTFTQVSTEEAVHDVRLSRHTLTFKLDDPIWHHTYNNSPIDFVGSKVTIHSITLPDLATNTANLKHVPNITLLDGETGEPLATSNDAPKDAALGKQIQLPSVNGTHVAAIPYVYTFPTALELDTSKTYTLRLNPNDELTTPPLLPVFRNASSEYTDADQSSVRIDGGDTRYSPYLAFNGKMTMKRFIYKLSASYYDLTTSTFTQDSTKEAVHDVPLSQRTLTFALNDPIWHYTYNGSSIDFVGSTVTIESITLPDLATNTANLTHVPSVTLLNANGKPLLDANGKEIKEITSETCTPGTQQIQLPSENDTHVAAIPYTYTFPTALELNTADTYTLRLNPNDELTTPPLLPVFRNASSEDTDANQSFVRIDGGDTRYSPYLAFNGKMTTQTRYSLNSLLEGDGFTTNDTTNDKKDTMVIVRLTTMDTILEMDHSLTNAALVVASDTPETAWKKTGEVWTPLQRAGTVRFLNNNCTFTGPVDFRDVKDATGEIKMIRLEYCDATSRDPIMTSQTNGNHTESVAVPIPRSLWNPSSFALHCDLEFAAYPDMSEETKEQPAWFGRNVITIPSGRSVRIVTHVAEDNRPNLAFADATSRLALAIPSSEPHVLSHYRALIEQNSGILRMVSPFEIQVPAGKTNALVLGLDDDPATAPSVQTLQSYAATEFTGSLILGYGVNNNAQYVQKSGSVTVAGEGLILGQGDAATAKYVVKNGSFTGKVTFGEQVHDAAFMVGDGVGEANTAIAELSALLSKPANSTTNITGTAEVIVERDGQLVLNGDLDMTPALRRRMTMNGGTLKATGATPSYTFGTDFVNGGGLSINGNVTIDASEATSSGTEATQLTIDALSGSGNLTIDGTVTLDNIGYFKGTIQAVEPSSDEALDGGSIRINALHGITSDITIGYLGRRDTSVVADILALTHKEGVTPYRGTLSFDATEYPLVDVSQTEELDVYARLRIQNGQTLRIRLDQFADATILWPKPIEQANPPKLEIVEAGAYGGELIIPHLPEEVAETLVFYHYDHNNILVQHHQNTFTVRPNEDGAYDTFEWEYPNFAHNSAWIDAEFEGNSYNTGWMRVGKDNALLKGTDWNGTTHVDSWGSVMTEDRFFTETRNPAGKGVKLCYRPYIELTDLKYPKVWSAAIRLTAPRKSNTTILALSSTCGGAYSPKLPDGDALILATGPNVPTSGPIPIVLYLAIDHAITGPEYDVWAQDELIEVATATIADISEIPHVISAVCDGKTLTVYLDGGFLTEYNLPDNWVGLATGGLQVGQVLSGSSNTGELNTLQSANPQDGGYVDYIRFYKGALTATAMAALAEEAPPVHQGVRYIRNVTEDGLWEYPLNGTTNPWLKQVWNTSTQKWTDSGYHARPSEGAEIRLFVKGECTLQINTEKDANNGFLSANRLYSALNVLPADATSTPKLTLQPIGGDVTLENQTSHTWMTGQADSDWQYGTIKFVGGGGDAIHPTAAHEAEAYDNPTDALGVHGMRTVNITSGEITTGAASASVPSAVTQTDSGSGDKKTWKQTRVLTQTRVSTRTFTGGNVAAIAKPSAGVVKFSRLSGVLVGGVKTDGVEERIETRTLTQTRTIRQKNEPTAEAWEKTSWTPAENRESRWSAWDETEDWVTVETQGGNLVQAVLELHADYSLIRGREEEERDFLHLTGPIKGRGKVVGNTEIKQPNQNGQVSEHVWVPTFDDGANWLVSDVTETFYGTGFNDNGTVAGLLAEIRQVPGRLYLDLAQTVADNGFSEQSWYRYGYPGASVYPTPVEAEDGDFAAAVSFQIRVPQGNTKQLTMDVKRNIATLNVEAASNVTETPTLKIDGDANKGLTIGKQLITFVRLEDIQENPALTLAGDALIHGHTTGTYAFKNRTWDRALLRDSIATLEAHGTNNVFKLDFELRNTNLVIADGAILEQEGEANHLWAKSLTMGNGATFRFHAAGEDSEANGVVFSENMKMTGTTATLHGYGQADGVDNTHRCNFTAAGIEGPTDKAAVLTLNSAGTERWICYTANLVDHSATGGKLGLTKIGTGIMAFRSPTPPSVTGPVSVNEGILRVGTKSFSDDALNAEQHLDAAIGHNGLHVAADASLEPNHYANPEDVIACIPSGQTLSGTGTIGGVLRLNSGAQLENCAGMTIRKMVVDGSTLPDIKVTLPTDIAEQAILFHMLNDSARAEVRRRFYATRNGVRWDVCVNHTKHTNEGRTCLSHYWVQSPRVPVPTEPSNDSANTFTSAFTNTMTRYYQGYSVAQLLSSTGYTKYVNADSNYKLNASEIENAFRCFTNIWTFARNEAPNTATSAYLDDEQSLLMAYEFGISRMAIRDLKKRDNTEARYLIVEVQVKNTLKDVFGDVVGAGNDADFQLGSNITFSCRLSNNGTNETSAITDAVEITDFDKATDLTPPTESSHTAGVRVFAIPFDEARFPLGTSSLSVKAVMPESTPPSNNDSATTASY